MCMCGRSPEQLGIPLNEFTLSKMSKEEQKFWNDFLQEADNVINEQDAKRDSKKPKKVKKNVILVPPPSLKLKYQKAIAEYGGEQYCQIQQLKKIFAFEDELLEE